MTLSELKDALAKLPHVSPRTQVYILRETRDGKVKREIFDVRFDGAAIVVEQTP
jgi:hypothetical protein